jgi:ribosomal protein L11 methyltransferase
VVIDVGCGSGILALAALALGAKQAIAIDADWAAAECAASNLADQIALGACRLIQGDGLACVRVRADVIVANISSEAACAIGQDVPGLLRSRGTYVATGFLSEAAGSISDKLAGGELALQRTDELEGWSSLTFARRESSDQ